MSTSFAPFESEQHYRALRKKLVTFFNYKRCPDPENLADETITRVYASCSQGAAPADVNRWAYGVARRVRLEWLRDPNSLAEPGAEDQPVAVRSPHQERFRMAAESVIGGLDPADRELIEEHYIDKQKYQALGDRLGITTGGVRAHFCRVRQALSRQFASEMQ